MIAPAEVLVRIDGELPQGIDALAAAALAEGYSHIERLAEEWRNNTVRFAAKGCVLLAAFRPDQRLVPVLAAIGGLTRDFIDASRLRMRRFYVRPEDRRQGLGRRLATALLQEGLSAGFTLVLHAGDARAAAFWEHLGFVATGAKNPTHIFPASSESGPESTKTPA